MPVLELQHAFQGKTFAAEDVYVNTWHLNTAVVPDAGMLLGAATAIQEFYNVVAPLATNAIVHYMSGVALAPGASIKIYNLGDLRPRQPIFSTKYDPTGGGAGLALPSEVACCLSFRGAIVSGQVEARRKGRVYLGPLNTAACASDGIAQPQRVAPVFQNDVLKAAQKLSQDLLVFALHVAVFSTVDQIGYPVVNYWIDNAFDTQRRRGERSTSTVSGDTVVAG